MLKRVLMSPWQSLQARYFSTIQAANPTGRVRQPVGEGLRAGRLDGRVAAFLAVPGLAPADVVQLLVGKVAR
jgi:hypothetical protein